MHINKSNFLQTGLSIFMVLVLSACGGGGSSSNEDSSGGFTAKESAIEKIQAYSNGESSSAPTLNDYIAVGVTGVTSETLAELNAIVEGLTPDEVDSTSELEALTTQLGINIVPTAIAGGNKTVQVNKSITITGSGTDSDGTIVGYKWEKGGVTLATTASFNYIPTIIGTDSLKLTVTDNNGDTASDTMNVIVTAVAVSGSDATPPVISLLGESSVNVDQGTSYVDAGATASDNVDGVITANIVVGGDNVNTNAPPGTSFTITYNVSDTAGNAATQVTRTVNIASMADTTDPVITLNGPSTVDVIQNSSYVDAGASATDNKDGSITANIVVAGDVVNTSSAAGTTFTITYNVSDAAGNPAIEVTRTVSIIEDTGHQIPVLSAATMQNYLATINTARSAARSCGVYGNFPAVPNVTWSDKLYKAAYEHSQDLAESNTFSHDGSNTISDWTGFPLNKKSSMVDRVATYGYSWSRLSENISAGTVRDTAQEAVDSWLASDGHCKNVMDANVTQVGMALASRQGSTYTHYWTQNFGKP